MAQHHHCNNCQYSHTISEEINIKIILINNKKKSTELQLDFDDGEFGDQPTQRNSLQCMKIIKK